VHVVYNLVIVLQLNYVIKEICVSYLLIWCNILISVCGLHVFKKQTMMANWR